MVQWPRSNLGTPIDICHHDGVSHSYCTLNVTLNSCPLPPTPPCTGQPFFCPNPGTQIDTCNYNGVSHGYCALNPTFSTCGIINTLSAPGTSNPTVVEPSCTSSYYTNAGGECAGSGLQPLVNTRSD